MNKKKVIKKIGKICNGDSFNLLLKLALIWNLKFDIFFINGGKIWDIKKRAYTEYKLFQKFILNSLTI